MPQSGTHLWQVFSATHLNPRGHLTPSQKSRTQTPLQSSIGSVATSQPLHLSPKGHSWPVPQTQSSGTKKSTQIVSRGTHQGLPFGFWTQVCLGGHRRKHLSNFSHLLVGTHWDFPSGVLMQTEFGGQHKSKHWSKLANSSTRSLFAYHTKINIRKQDVSAKRQKWSMY